MKRITSFLLAFVLVAATPVPALAAGNPTEDFKVFVPTGREDPELDALCREELGLAPEDTPVAVKLFQLRRCINAKKRALGRKKFVQQSRLRSADRETASQARINKLLNREASRVKKAQRRNSAKRLTFKQKDTSNRLRKALRSSRARKRSEVNKRERARTMNVKERAASRRHIRNACASVNRDERQECIKMQLHNLNLMEDRETNEAEDATEESSEE